MDAIFPKFWHAFVPKLGPVLDKWTIPVEKPKLLEAGILLWSFDPDYVFDPVPNVVAVPLFWFILRFEYALFYSFIESSSIFKLAFNY